MSDDRELLTEVDSIGSDRADTPLERFESGREVAKAAAYSWGRIAELDGFTDDSASTLFDRMLEAGVYKDLRNHESE